MKTSLLGTLLLGLLLAAPMPTQAEVFVDVNISLPPPIGFSAPPELIVLPGTYVYVAPDVDEEIFFYGGYWWRPWEGHWYRSRHYGSGWSSYRSVPSFYRGIPSGWRDDYRQHQWQGRQWNHHPIPYQNVHRNWKGWEKNRYWEKQKSWGVEGLQQQKHPRQPSRDVQSQQSRPRSREAYSERSQPQGNRERGGQVRQQSPAQGKGAKSERSPQQHGKSENGAGKQHGRP
jgi:hypothetical protein